MKNLPKFSLVVPVYMNQDSINDLILSLIHLQKRLAAKTELDCIFVVDGSPDNSEMNLKLILENSPLCAQVLSLSRNFGSQNAIKAGLMQAEGEFIAIMAADLQEPVSLYEDFFNELSNNNFDVAIGTRTSRIDPLFSKLLSRFYWRLYRKWVNPDIPRGGADIFACTRKVADKLSSFNESDSSLIGLLFWIGFSRTFVEYERQERHSGKSAWTFKKKVRYFLDSVYSFTDLPIILIQFIGALGVSLSFVAGIFIFLARFLGYINEPGYAPLMITMFLTSSAVLLALGIVGNYVSRSYVQAKNRPYAIVSNVWANTRRNQLHG